MRLEPIQIEGFDLKIAPTPAVHLGDIELHMVGNTINSAEGRRAIIKAAFYGIRRARKECEASGGITLEWLEENIDINNVKALTDAFMKVNFDVIRRGDVPEGEAQAGVPS